MPFISSEEITTMSLQQLQDKSRNAGLIAKGNTNQLRKRLIAWNEQSQSQQKDEPDAKRSKNTTSDDDEKFFCSICLNVASDVLESSCCGNLYCRECAGTSFESTRVCPTCRVTHTGYGIPESWRHSTWIQRQINEFAPKCLCGRNIPKAELLEHGKVCPKLNLPCYKCKATGSFETTAGSTMKCDACQGTKMLLGLEWKKCLKCKGSGAYNTVLGRKNCQPCSGIGALKGKDWTKCTKCEGIGGHTTVNSKLVRVNCSACNSNGVLKGVDWTTCFKCKGSGAYNTTVSPFRTNCQPCEARGQLKGKNWTKCFKCKGYGGLSTKKKCDACDSNGVLVGVDWTNCAKCEGSGSLTVLTPRVCDVDCDACTAMGYLKGLGWVSCTKCEGNGGHATRSGTIVNCSTCNGTAQVKG